MGQQDHKDHTPPEQQITPAQITTAQRILDELFTRMDVNYLGAKAVGELELGGYAPPRDWAQKRINQNPPTTANSLQNIDQSLHDITTTQRVIETRRQQRTLSDMASLGFIQIQQALTEESIKYQKMREKLLLKQETRKARLLEGVSLKIGEHAVRRILEVQGYYEEIQADNSDLINRLQNWQREILFVKFFEYKAINMIAKAMIADLHQIPTPEERVLAITQNARIRINQLIPRTGIAQTEVYTIEHRDSVTGEPFYTRFRREPEEVLVAEEIRPDNSVILRAKITPQGETELTLHFTEYRYESADANPNITFDTRFPTGTATVFNLLAGKVGK